MAVYFKYKSAKDYDSIPIFDQFISVGNLKLKIFESKRYGKGKDFDLVITNSQTNQDYVDQDTLIPKNTRVLIRRLPLLPIVILSLTEPKQVCEQEARSVKPESIYSLDFVWDDFGDDVYAIPKILPIQSGNNPVRGAPTSGISSNDEDIKIKNLIDTPDFGQSSNGYGFGRGGMEWKKLPSGYVCHRCNVPGHYIQHCPTNCDPNYDIKKVKLMATPSGGSVGVSKEIEGLSSVSSSSSSKRSFRYIPPELHCPLCKGLMKDAVIASKCCFSSFCDKCIRDHIISYSICVCGARNILVDALLPNITLRVTINRILESKSNTSSEHGVSAQNMASTHNTLPLKTVMSVHELLSKPITEEAVKMKKRKKPCDDDA
ncbi:hypothetical protein RND71_018293 [Anisodus tanguticus]|uniref:DWNN domain-containing protein n=1 Tax=Anisodus tanguticus TaxID=243964 RepID=A0AAE1VBZ1_9SOLA|nr:hypothetical protein RND71_018293 [Anisodus tanguticus]